MIVVIVDQPVQHVLTGEPLAVLDLQKSYLEAGLLERVAQALAAEERDVLDVSDSRTSACPFLARRSRPRRAWSPSARRPDAGCAAARWQRSAGCGSCSIVWKIVTASNDIARCGVVVQATDRDVESETSLHVLGRNRREVDASDVVAAPSRGIQEEARAAADVEEAASWLYRWRSSSFLSK